MLHVRLSTIVTCNISDYHYKNHLLVVNVVQRIRFWAFEEKPAMH